MFENFSRKLKKKADQFAKGTVDVVYDRRHDFAARVYAVFLKALSFIFSAVVYLRYFMYNKRILRDAPLGCLVVIVGNLTVGGTGKTPVVEKFARELASRGRKVAILSRGYKSKSDSMFTKFKKWLTHGEASKPKVVSDGKNILLNSLVAGDEPYMLAKNLPNVMVIVDKNRVKAGHYAIKEFGADTLILDDGFQYLPLKGQLQLLLVDKTNPFGNKSLLPRGILREPVSHLNRASYIFLTKSDGKRDLPLEEFIRKYNPHAEIIECAHTIQFLTDFSLNRRAELSILKGKKIACFCGIAMPDSFENFMLKCGAEIIYKEHFMDHHRFSFSELDEFFDAAEKEGAQMVVTTEKDAVRIEGGYKPKLPFFYTRLEIDILSGDKDFKTAVERICFKERPIHIK